jgi:hypothetical protein
MIELSMSELPVDARDFLFFLTVQNRSGAHPTYQTRKGATSVGLKGPERESAHSLPSVRLSKKKTAFST